MKNKAQITYRFDRQPLTHIKDEHRHHDQEIAFPQGDDEVQEVPPVYGHGSEDVMTSSNDSIEMKREANLDWSHFADHYRAWQSPYDIETEELEKIIREASQPSEADREETVELKQGEHQSDDAKIEDGKEQYRETVYNDDLYTDPVRTHHMRGNSKSWGTIFVSVIGAIMTGALFGIFILSLFTNGNDTDRSLPDVQQMLNPQQKGAELGIDFTIEPDDGQDVIDNELHDEPLPNMLPLPAPATDSSALVNIPSKSYYLLQNGVFSTADSAQSAMQQLTSNGFAAASELWDHHYVYAGMSVNRDDALLLSHMLHEEEYETYIKMVTLPAVQSVRWHGESAEKFQDYIIQGNQLAEMISSLTIIHLQQTTATEIDVSFMASITKAHQAWNGLSTAVQEGMPDNETSALQKMDTALNTTMLLLEAYRKNPSFSYLWQTQTALLNFILLQKQLLQSIAIS